VPRWVHVRKPQTHRKVYVWDFFDFFFNFRKFETSHLMGILLFLRNRDAHEPRNYILASKFVDHAKELFGKNSTELTVH